MGNDKGGELLFLPPDTGLGHPYYCIFDKVAWSCPPGCAGRHKCLSHTKLRASTVKGFKLNTKGRPAHWSRSQNNPIGIREKNTLSRAGTRAYTSPKIAPASLLKNPAVPNASQELCFCSEKPQNKRAAQK